MATQWQRLFQHLTLMPLKCPQKQLCTQNRISVCHRALCVVLCISPFFSLFIFISLSFAPLFRNKVTLIFPRSVFHCSLVVIPLCMCAFGIQQYIDRTNVISKFKRIQKVDIAFWTNQKRKTKNTREKTRCSQMRSKVEKAIIPITVSISVSKRE